MAPPPVGSSRTSPDHVLLVHQLGIKEARAARAALAADGMVACVSATPRPAAELAGRVSMLPEGALPTFADGAAVEGAFELVEEVASRLVARRPAVARFLERFTGSGDVDRYLCRCLLFDVGALLALALLVASGELSRYERVVIESHWPQWRELATVAELVDSGRAPLPPEVSHALDRLVFLSHMGWKSRIAGAAASARELAILWGQSLRLLRRSEGLPHRPVLIRSYDWDWAFDRGGQPRLRNVDFLVDGRTIRPDEVGVWLEEGVPLERRHEAETRGYAALSRADVGVGALGFVIRFLPSLVRSTAVFARLAMAESWWHRPIRRLLAQSLLWWEIARQARPRVFVAYNDFLPSGIARTLALRRAGCLSVEYEFSSHWRTDECGWIPDFVYGFGVVDVMVTWGALHSAHLRDHRGRIGEFWEVGCLWSEHARLVAEGLEISPRYRQDVERMCGEALSEFEAVVGVFDTSTASFFGADDMVAFYEGVAALATRLPTVLFLCKPKRPLQDVFRVGRGGREIEVALAKAGNVVLLDRHFETAAVVGLSDLSVNACFTSPAVESIGLGRPALYYDPTDLFPASFFRRIPRFVATTPEDIGRLVEEQLALRGEALAVDLRERFAALEGHFDGLAITRLRERLRAVLDG